jgi:O-antigen ligase
MYSIRNILFYLLLGLALFLPLTEAPKNLFLILFIIFGVVALFKQQIKIKLDAVNILIILIPITVLISAYFAIDVANSFKGSKSIITASLLFVLFRELSLSRLQIKTLLFTVFLGLFLSLIWGYYDLYNGATYLQLHSVGHVNHSSIYMLLSFVIALIFTTTQFRNLSKPQLVFSILIILFSLLSVFITGSRATMYSLIGITSLFTLYSLKNFGNKASLYSIVALLVIAMLIIFGISEQKFQKGILDNTPRVDLINGFFWAWWNNNIWTGIGIGNSYMLELREYYPQSMFETMPHAHNTFLTYLTERGLIGLMPYLIFNIVILVFFIKQLLLDSKNYLIIIALAMFIVNSVISFANTTFHHENALLMLIVWALAIGSSRKTT